MGETISNYAETTLSKSYVEKEHHALSSELNKLIKSGDITYPFTLGLVNGKIVYFTESKDKTDLTTKVDTTLTSIKVEK